MKTPAIILASLGLALGSLQAQTVPLFINYQGKVAGGTGIPLGSTGTAPNFTAAPVNRKIIFRIFDAPTAGTRLWSEQQTATIALGDFSVLLGAGIDAVYNSVTESRPALDTIFNGAIPPGNSNRYLEIVVDDGSGTFTTADAPVIPRQRITSTAYSLRAKMADTVPGAAIDAIALAAGAVTAEKLVDNVISSVKIADLSVLTEDLANNSVTAAKIADLSITGDDLANATVTAAKLHPSIGVWAVNGDNVYRPAGSVGIGKQPAAGVALDVVGQIFATGNITSQGTIAALGDINTFSNINALGSLTASSITTTGPFAATNITANGAMRARGGPPGALGVNNNGFAFTGNGGDNDSGMFSSADGQVEFYTNLVERMRISPGGIVGIGTTTNPTGAKLVVMGSNPRSIGGHQQMTGSFVGGGGNVPAANVSIYAEREIHAEAFRAFSDGRIKVIQNLSDSAADLHTLLGIEITDYTHKDTRSHGSEVSKKVIAQQVEKVFPQAVRKTTDAIPDIYQKAAVKGGWVELKTDLRKGERVRLIGDSGEGIYDVLETAPGKFRTGYMEKDGEIFVFGREVNDFRTVDYEAIAMLNVSATQQIKKEKDAEIKLRDGKIAALEAKLAGMLEDVQFHEARLAEMAQHEKSQEARLARLEKAFAAGEPAPTPATPATPRTVSLRTGK